MRYEYRYWVMLSNGDFMNIDGPTRENEFNDDCCMLKLRTMTMLINKLIELRLLIKFTA